MAERTPTFTMSQKTQESMRKKLEEWRKTKQQTVNQLRPKTTPFKSTNSQTLQTKRHDTKSTRKSMPYSVSSVYKPKENNVDRILLKRKSFSATVHKTTTSQKTAEQIRVRNATKRTNNNPSNALAFNKNPPQNFEIEKDPDPKKTRRSTFTKEELVFNEKPPSNFEIETEPDEKKARRSTFTIDSPNPAADKKDKHPTLRKQLETWRKDKRSQPKPDTNKTNKNAKAFNTKRSTISSKPQAKPVTQKKTMVTSQAKSLTVHKDLSRKVPAKKPASSNLHKNNIRTFPKKTEIGKSTCPVKAPKKDFQASKLHMTPSKPANLSKTTPMVKKPSMKTPVYIDKSKTVRERLELWRKEKGKTPKPSKTPSAKRKSNNTTNRKEQCEQPESQPIPLQIQPSEMINNETTEGTMSEDIQRKLHECLEKVKANVKNNLEEISCQLDEMQKEHNDVLQHAEYWLCRAKIAEDNGDHDRVICLYQQAIAFNAEPASIIEEEMSLCASKLSAAQQQPQETSTEGAIPMDDQNESPCQSVIQKKKTVTPQQATTNDVFMSPSTNIRYSVTKATPYRSRLKTSERPTVTPVRRSVRLERRSVHYPSMLQDHSLTVKHLDELPQEMKDDVSFRPNFAVQSELNDAWKEIMEC